MTVRRRESTSPLAPRSRRVQKTDIFKIQKIDKKQEDQAMALNK